MRYSVVIPTFAIIFTVMGTPLVSYGQDCDPIEVTEIHASDWEQYDEFGYSVALSGNTALIGMLNERDDRRSKGTVYVFRFNGSEWFEEARLRSFDPVRDEFFGFDVAVWDDTAVVNGSVISWNDPGCAYVFQRNKARWVAVAKVQASDGVDSNGFGIDLAVFDDVIVAGAPRDDEYGTSSGAAYVFRFDGSQWVQEAKLHASDGAEWDEFGRAVAISNDVVVVGAYRKNGDVFDTGAAYVYRYDGTQWVEQAILLDPDTSLGHQFGWSVAIDDETIVVGAARSLFGPEYAGAAHVFRRDGKNWNHEAKLVASDGQGKDLFGWSVAISGDNIICGAYRADGRSFLEGAAYFFQHDGSNWVEVEKLTPRDRRGADHFGGSVALSDETVLIGATGDNDFGVDTGSAYIFDLNCPASSCLDLTIDNLSAGEEAVYTITGGTEGAKSVTVYGTEPGHTRVYHYAGYCANFGIKGVHQAKVLGGFQRRFDSGGEITFRQFIPDGAAGLELRFQSAQRGTCPDECMSNLVEAVVR